LCLGMVFVLEVTPVKAKEAFTEKENTLETQAKHRIPEETG
jgi:hypothetical protein